MFQPLPKYYILSEEVQRARRVGAPLVALESTVITHGLPRPENLRLAHSLEEEVRKAGAVPATIAVLDGEIKIGLTESELERLAYFPEPQKISRRDFSAAIAQKASGGTTVAGTLIAGHTAGLQVFSTGGIGGVHRQAPFDVSPDLYELARTPMLVVCAGAKAILDLPATLETLETLGVPVVGFQTNRFPAFYSVDSGLPVSTRADTPEEVAAIAQAQWNLGLRSAVLVASPPPETDALPSELVEGAIEQALADASNQNIHGQAVTPFLLNRVNQLTGGASLHANLSLLRNNARLAARIAPFLRSHIRERSI